MSSISKSFTAIGNGGEILVNKKTEDRAQFLNYKVSGTFAATWYLEKTTNNGLTRTVVLSGTAAASGKIEITETAAYRFTCPAFTSGTMVTQIAEYKNLDSEKEIVINASDGKVGGTAGFTVNAASNISLATCAAGSTAAKFVIPIAGLKVGDLITKFTLVGQIESAGNAVTVDAALHRHNAVAADVSDTAITGASMTQVSVTADATLGTANAQAILEIPETVTDDATYFLLITVTTGASADVALQGVRVGIA